MKTGDAIKAMAKDSGRSVRGVSQAMGRNPDYLGMTLSRGSVPKADTLARAAEACGYRLALVPAGSLPDDSLVIDPAE